MAVEFEQGGRVGTASLGIPGATVNIDRADNMFDINNKEAVGAIRAMSISYLRWGARISKL